MSYEYIRNYYGVPAEHGRRVEYNGKPGVICGAVNQYVKIHFDGDKKPRGPFHPKDGITYHGMGKVPKLTRSQERYQRYLSIGDLFENFRQFLRHDCAK